MKQMQMLRGKASLWDAWVLFLAQLLPKRVCFFLKFPVCVQVSFINVCKALWDPWRKTEGELHLKKPAVCIWNLHCRLESVILCQICLNKFIPLRVTSLWNMCCPLEDSRFITLLGAAKNQKVKLLLSYGEAPSKTGIRCSKSAFRNIFKTSENRFHLESWCMFNPVVKYS